VIAALATACGERKESSEGAARPPDSPPPRTQPALPTAPPAAPAFDAAPLPPLPPPLPAQLPAHAAAMQFLGWTGDGRMYAIRATHGYDEEELGGPNQVALFQVHDTATGALVRSFQIQRLAGDEVRDDDLLSRAWAQSQPKPAWQQFRADTPLVARDPALASPDATWTIAGEPADKPPQQQPRHRGSRRRRRDRNPLDRVRRRRHDAPEPTPAGLARRPHRRAPRRAVGGAFDRPAALRLRSDQRIAHRRRQPRGHGRDSRVLVTGRRPGADRGRAPGIRRARRARRHG
jgi:hypothetical protein